jgi:hypothetical protein
MNKKIFYFGHIIAIKLLLLTLCSTFNNNTETKHGGEVA